MDIPENIYLNIEPESTTYLCWCEDRQNESDIEYIRKINNKTTFKNKYSLPRYDELEKFNETLVKFFIDNKFLSDCIDCNLDDCTFCGMKSVKIAIEQIKQKPIEEILKDYE